MPTSLADATPPLRDERAGRWAPWWVLAYVALWPLPGIAETVLGLGALYAAARMVIRRVQHRPHLLSPAAWALTSILFLGYWLPQAFSAFDAVDPSASWTKAAAGLRYLPFMWLVAIAVATPQRRRLTLGGLAVITGLWTLDALVQALAGTSPWFWSLQQIKLAISGHALCPADEAALADRLSGALGPCNLKFGQVLASLSPFLLLPVARRFGNAGWLLAAAAVGVVLLLAGSRASWITFGLVVVYSGVRQLGWKRLGLLALAAALPSQGAGCTRPIHTSRPQPYSADSAPSAMPAVHCAGMGRRPSGFFRAHTASSHTSVAGKAAPVNMAICESQTHTVSAPKRPTTATMACTNSTARSTTPTLQVSNTRSRTRASSGICASGRAPSAWGSSWKLDKIRESFMGSEPAFHSVGHPGPRMGYQAPLQTPVKPLATTCHPTNSTRNPKPGPPYSRSR